MAETQVLVNAPPTGTNLLALTSIPWLSGTGLAQATTLRDPQTGVGLTVDSVNGITVNGTLRVSNFPASQTVSGTVNVGNFPNTQPVSGTVSVGNFPSASGSAANSTGTAQFIPIADSQVAINVTAAGTVALVTGVAGKRIYVTGFDFTSDGTGTVQFVHGTGNTPLTGPYAVVAQFGASRGNGVGAIWTLPAGDSLSIIVGGASATAQGSLSYTIF